MSTESLLRTAARALGRSRLRTGLTTLSLIIGVASVITIVALGAGARAAVEQNVMAAGTNLIVVSAGSWTSSGVRMGMGSSSRLTEGDAQALRGRIRGIAYVSPSVRTRQQLINGRLNWSASIDGVGADLPLIRRWPVASGTFFTADHVRQAAKVAVIGTIVRDQLFEPGSIPVGHSIRIGSQIFRVIGVLTSKGQSSVGRDQDDAVFVPYTTAQKKLMGVTYLRSILVSSSRADETSRVAGDIRRLLRDRHEIPPAAADDFRVRTLEEIASLRTRATRTMTTLLSGVAAVSLLVGGIGVMNIMLVSVSERTREIGLRIAVGARQRDVLRQFLVEATLLSVLGGALGIACGTLLAKTLTHVLQWPTLVAPQTALTAFAAAVLVGIFFGWYPARRAASFEPIDALHAE